MFRVSVSKPAGFCATEAADGTSIPLAPAFIEVEEVTEAIRAVPYVIIEDATPKQEDA